MDAEEQAPQQRSHAWVVWAWLGLFVVVVLLCSGVFSGDDGEPSDDALRLDVERVCKEAVGNRLKAPSTAEYDLTVTGGPATYTVTGTVDAENSFGAMLQGDVECVVRDSGDSWTTSVSLTGLD